MPQEAQVSATRRVYDAETSPLLPERRRIDARSSREAQAAADQIIGSTVNVIIEAAEKAAKEIRDRANLEAIEVLRQAEQHALARIEELTRKAAQAKNRSQPVRARHDRSGGFLRHQHRRTVEEECPPASKTNLALRRLDRVRLGPERMIARWLSSGALPPDGPVRRLRRHDPRLRRHRPLRAGLRRRDRRARRRHLRGELRRQSHATWRDTTIEDVDRLPACRRRDRRAALPGLLAAQPRRRRLRATRASGASTSARSSESDAERVRDGERPRAPPLGRVRGVQGGRRGRSSASRVDGRVLNAADYGVPQRRRRAIVIGVRDGDVPWPDADARRPGGASRSDGQPWRTFRDAVEGLPLQAERQGLAHRPQPAARDASSATSTSRTTAATASRCRTASTPPGSVTSSRACWRNKPTGTTDVFGRLYWKRPGVHDPDRVLQAREGPLPAPERGPTDHDPRGRTLHELPGRLRASRRPEVDRDREADRKRGPPLLARAVGARPSSRLSTRGDGRLGRLTRSLRVVADVAQGRPASRARARRPVSTAAVRRGAPRAGDVRRMVRRSGPQPHCLHR